MANSYDIGDVARIKASAFTVAATSVAIDPTKDHAVRLTTTAGGSDSPVTARRSATARRTVGGCGS